MIMLIYVLYYVWIYILIFKFDANAHRCIQLIQNAELFNSHMGMKPTP